MKFVNWILVPVDYSIGSRAALEFADYQAEWWEGGLIVLHVETLDLKETLGAPLDKKGLELWSRIIKRTPPQKVAYIKCKGDPIERIISIAKEYRVRAIFMGQGGKGEKPGRIASEVTRRYNGHIELFSGKISPVTAFAG